MFGRIIVAAISILITASATSDPEVPAPAVTASLASVDAVVPENPSAPPAVNLQDLDAPDMPQTASASPENDPDEMICRRMRETGSRFTTKICRTRAEIEAREVQDQKIIRGSRSIRTGGHCALNKDC